MKISKHPSSKLLELLLAESRQNSKYIIRGVCYDWLGAEVEYKMDEERQDILITLNNPYCYLSLKPREAVELGSKLCEALQEYVSELNKFHEGPKEVLS